MPTEQPPSCTCCGLAPVQDAEMIGMAEAEVCDRCAMHLRLDFIAAGGFYATQLCPRLRAERLP